MNRLKKNVRCLRNDRVKNYIACVSACLCYSSQLFKESADFRSHLHGLQFDHGDYIADSGISRFGDYGSGCRRGSDKYPFLCNT